MSDGAVQEPKGGLMGFIERIRPNKHTTIERFGWQMLALAVTGALILGPGIGEGIANGRATLGAQAVYVSSFETSRTTTSGVVEGVYRSPNGKNALIMMQVGDGSLGSMSADASTYQAFIIGATPGLKNANVETSGLTGEIVVFGSTGYIGVVLRGDEPIADQLLDITMRANTELQAVDKKGTDTHGLNDSSYEDYDQWKIYANPGAVEAEIADELDEVELDYTRLYYDSVIDAREAELRLELDKSLSLMRASLVRIDELVGQVATTSVDGMSLVAPAPPANVEGDTVIGEPGTVVEETYTDESGSSKTRMVEETPSTLELETRWIEPGGYSVDWRSGSVREGYIASLAEEDENVVQYLNRKRAEREAARNDSNKTQTYADGEEVRWKLQPTGEDLFLDYTEASAGMRPLFTLANGLDAEYETYRGLKAEYQVGQLGALMDLEAQLIAVGSSTTEHSGENAVTVFELG